MKVLIKIKLSSKWSYFQKKYIKTRLDKKVPEIVWYRPPLAKRQLFKIKLEKNMLSLLKTIS